jgi:hypothetical protein
MYLLRAFVVQQSFRLAGRNDAFGSRQEKG